MTTLSVLSIFLVSIIQGITEFLPISSSGHLILLPVVTGLPDQGQTADVAAHLGTLAAVMLYLRRDLFAMATSLLPVGPPDKGARRLAGLLILASLPVIAMGLVVELAAPVALPLVERVVLLRQLGVAACVAGLDNLTRAAALERLRGRVDAARTRFLL